MRGLPKLKPLDYQTCNVALGLSIAGFIIIMMIFGNLIDRSINPDIAKIEREVMEEIEK
jgi:hypothetical protein